MFLFENIKNIWLIICKMTNLCCGSLMRINYWLLAHMPNDRSNQSSSQYRGAMRADSNPQLVPDFLELNYQNKL